MSYLFSRLKGLLIYQKKKRVIAIVNIDCQLTGSRVTKETSLGMSVKDFPRLG